MEAARPAIFLRGWRRGGPPLAAAVTLAWSTWGSRTSGEDLVVQAQAVKVVTANTKAASVLAADGGHAR